MRIVLVVITHIEGASARNIGSPLVVCEDGRFAGYVSSGCLDQDIAGQALETLHDNKSRHVRYGEGSPYLDLRLPCGGGLDVVMVPDPDVRALKHMIAELRARREVSYKLETHIFTYTPPLQIIIFGNTAEADRLADVANLSGLVTKQRSDYADLETDIWSAIVLMFHEHDKEISLLQQAVTTPAFYIGAMGSRKAHADRHATLTEAGMSKADISRIKAPIGLVPSARDAGRLAVSVLADIFETDRLRRL